MTLLFGAFTCFCHFRCCFSAIPKRFEPKRDVEVDEYSLAAPAAVVVVVLVQQSWLLESAAFHETKTKLQHKYKTNTTTIKTNKYPPPPTHSHPPKNKR